MGTRTMSEIFESLDRTEELVAKIAKESEESAKKHDKFVEEHEKFVARHDKFVAEHEKFFEEYEKISVESAKSMADLKATVKAVSKQLGGMANSDGAFAEELFYHTLGETMQFGGQHYDIADSNIERLTNGVHSEFDILMYNSTSVAIIEVKYKADLEDIDELVTKKVARFRTLFPQYKDCNIYLGIGSMSFDKKVVKKAYNLGIGILRQKGDIIETDTDNIRAY